MATQYVEKLNALLDALKPTLPRGKSIDIKHFFGGAAAYIDGRIFMSLTKVGLALKLPEEDRVRLLRSKRAKKMRYFPKAPVKKQYALFPASFVNDRGAAKAWIETSVAFAIRDK